MKTITHWVVPQQDIDFNGETLYKLYALEAGSFSSGMALKLYKNPVPGLYTEEEVKHITGELS